MNPAKRRGVTACGTLLGVTLAALAVLSSARAEPPTVFTEDIVDVTRQSGRFDGIDLAARCAALTG